MSQKKIQTFLKKKKKLTLVQKSWPTKWDFQARILFLFWPGDLSWVGTRRSSPWRSPVQPVDDWPAFLHCAGGGATTQAVLYIQESAFADWFVTFVSLPWQHADGVCFKAEDPCNLHGPTWPTCGSVGLAARFCASYSLRPCVVTVRIPGPMHAVALRTRSPAWCHRRASGITTQTINVRVCLCLIYECFSVLCTWPWAACVVSRCFGTCV